MVRPRITSSLARRALPTALAVAGVGIAGCGGDDDRDRVEQFIGRANAVQAEAAPALRQVNDTYTRFAAGELEAAEAAPATRRAARTLSAIRSDVEAIEAPAEARRLKARLLDVYDAAGELATQTARTANYLVGQERAVRSVPRYGRELRSALGDESGGPEAQARALERHADRLRRVAARIRRLRPPAILLADHRAQLDRLEASRETSRRLRAAILARDPAAASRHVRRLREINLEGPDERLTRVTRRRYERLLERLATARQEVRAELARLERTLR